jgi:hypothetical protein
VNKLFDVGDRVRAVTGDNVGVCGTVTKVPDHGFTIEWDQGQTGRSWIDQDSILRYVERAVDTIEDIAKAYIRYSKQWGDSDPGSVHLRRLLEQAVQVAL